MSEVNEALTSESFNFADLFCKMGDPVVVIKHEETKNNVLESLEEVEKKLLGIY